MKLKNNFNLLEIVRNNLIMIKTLKIFSLKKTLKIKSKK